MSDDYSPCIQSVTYNITSTDVYSAFSIFNSTLLPKAENLLPSHDEEKLHTLINFYGIPQQITFEGQTRFLIPDIDGEQAEAEWKIFPRIIYTSYNNCSYSTVLANLLTNSTLKAGFLH